MATNTLKPTKNTMFTVLLKPSSRHNEETNKTRANICLFRSHDPLSIAGENATKNTSNRLFQLLHLNCLFAKRNVENPKSPYSIVGKTFIEYMGSTPMLYSLANTKYSNGKGCNDSA